MPAWEWDRSIPRMSWSSSLDGATRRELVLPDWGFAHNEADNGPDGLKNLADPGWASLRDEPIGRLNTMIRSHDAAQVGSDVRALARTLACVLLGKDAYIERHKGKQQSTSHYLP